MDLKKLLKKESGFTLVELLIVIVILMLLMGIVAINIATLRKKQRDGLRKSNIRQIQSAIELYRTDVGTYPAVGSRPGCNASLTAVVNGTTVNYLREWPCDPGGSGQYSYTSAGATYTIEACLENASDAAGQACTMGGCGTNRCFQGVQP